MRIFLCKTLISLSVSFLLLGSTGALALTPQQQKLLDELTQVSDPVLLALNAHLNTDSPNRSDLQNKAVVQDWIAKAKRCQDLIDQLTLTGGLAGGYSFDFSEHGTPGLKSPLSLTSFGRDVCARTQQLSERTLTTLP